MFDNDWQNLASIIAVAVAWHYMGFRAGHTKGYIEGRKAVRKHYEQVGK